MGFVKALLIEFIEKGEVLGRHEIEIVILIAAQS